MNKFFKSITTAAVVLTMISAVEAKSPFAGPYAGLRLGVGHMNAKATYSSVPTSATTINALAQAAAANTIANAALPPAALQGYTMNGLSFEGGKMGVLGGLVLGWNFEPSSQFLVGPELRATLGSITAKVVDMSSAPSLLIQPTNAPLTNSAAGVSVSSRMNVVTVKFRNSVDLAVKLGYSPQQNVLIYGRLGGSYVNYKVTEGSGLGAPAPVITSVKGMRLLIGAGAQIAVANRTSVFFDYQYGASKSKSGGSSTTTLLASSVKANVGEFSAGVIFNF